MKYFLGKDFPTLRLKASRDDILAQKEQNPDPQEALRYYQVFISERIFIRNATLKFKMFLRLVSGVLETASGNVFFFFSYQR